MKQFFSYSYLFLIGAILISSCTAGTMRVNAIINTLFNSKNKGYSIQFEQETQQQNKLKNKSETEENGSSEEILEKIISERSGTNLLKDYKLAFNNFKKEAVEERIRFEALDEDISSSEIDINDFYSTYKDEKYNKYTFIPDLDTLAVIKGLVKGKADTYFKISQKRKYGDDYLRNIKIDHNNNNQFNRAIRITESGFFKLEHQGKTYPVFITPGDTIDLTIDHSTSEGLIFKGRSAAANNYMRCKMLQEKSMAKEEYNLYNLDFEEFTSKLAYLKNIRDCNFNDLLSSDERISVDFIEAEEANINYEWARDIIGYKNKQGRFDKDKALKKIIDKINKYKKHSFSSDEYRAFAMDYFEYQSKRNLELKYGKNGMYEYSNVARGLMKYDDIDKLFDDRLTKDYLKTNLVSDIIKLVKSYRVNPLVKKFRKDVNNRTYLREIESLYYKNVRIDDGAFAPNFTITDQRGRTFTKNDLLGKYTYIAVWATWCAPCKIEQPPLQRLRDEYAHLSNFQILSVSIDEEKQKWLNALSSRSLRGKQYHAPGNWQSKFVEAFNLKSVPKYILINPDGEILDLSTSKPSRDIRRRLLDAGLSL